MKKYLLLLALLLCTTLALWAAPAANPPAKPPAPAPAIPEFPYPKTVSPYKNDVSDLHIKQATDHIAHLITTPEVGYQLNKDAVVVATQMMANNKGAMWVKIDPNDTAKATAISSVIPKNTTTWCVVKGTLSPKVQAGPGQAEIPKYDWVHRLNQSDAKLLVILAQSYREYGDPDIADNKTLLKAAETYAASNDFKERDLIVIGKELDQKPTQFTSVTQYPSYAKFKAAWPQPNKKYNAIIWLGHGIFITYNNSITYGLEAPVSEEKTGAIVPKTIGADIQEYFKIDFKKLEKNLKDLQKDLEKSNKKLQDDQAQLKKVKANAKPNQDKVNRLDSIISIDEKNIQEINKLIKDIGKKLNQEFVFYDLDELIAFLNSHLEADGFLGIYGCYVNSRIGTEFPSIMDIIFAKILSGIIVTWASDDDGFCTFGEAEQTNMTPEERENLTRYPGWMDSIYIKQKQ